MKKEYMESIIMVYSKQTKQGFLGGSMLKNLPSNAGDVGSIPGSGRSLEEEMANTQVFLPGKSHGPRSLVGYSPKE